MKLNSTDKKAVTPTQFLGFGKISHLLLWIFVVVSVVMQNAKKEIMIMKLRIKDQIN